jgi:hypothetical protein
MIIIILIKGPLIFTGGECAMRMKKPYVARLDQVRISRQDEYGIIVYIEPNVSSVNLKIGPQIRAMSDMEILDEHNRILQVRQQMVADYENIAFEIPFGRPQIEYSTLCRQWSPRGNVLRCVIGDGPNGEAIIYIDEQELSLAEFGRMLTTYAGWGMRIVFVPDDRLAEKPDVVVLDPEEKANG